MRSDICIRTAPTLRYLTRDQMDDIHFAGLEILERIGVQVYHEESLAL
jgi:trimethylamine:corrinoid methyltransferase-like protein